MKQRISLITLVVSDYDEAIRFYTKNLGFTLLEDTPLDHGKRWVRVCPPGMESGAILLAKAVTPEQAKAVGNQSGGRVFLFLETDDFNRDYDQFRANGVEFVRKPTTETYGTVAVFKDLYGNLWDLIKTSTN